MLASYAKGVQAMLNLPADHPHNWFRNAFVHLLDCPHGNWWFYVWHRGYLGFVERAIRKYSSDDSFALPYWDWTQLPQVPDGMFDGVLTPTNGAYEPYTGNLERFTIFLRPALGQFWNRLSADQIGQLNLRGYKQLEDAWNDVTGFSATTKGGVSGNEAFATTCGARYLSRANPKLDDKTAYNASEFVVYAGLLPKDFYNSTNHLSFNSSMTPSHNSPPPNGRDSFSTLEGLPHNKIHNYIGGVGPLDPGPYGNMTNFLSPVDPIFFLHHANMDRLWDVWTRKQVRRGDPYLPSGQQLQLLSNEPFLFYIDADGKDVRGKAGDYFGTESFDYDYEPGFGEKIVETSGVVLTPSVRSPVTATLRSGIGSLNVPQAAVQNFLGNLEERSLVAAITVSRPTSAASGREFDVLINAPAGVSRASVGSPYYAGTIAFFGPTMPGMKMASDVTFAVPLPGRQSVFSALDVAGNSKIDIQLIPSGGRGEAPAIKALHLDAL